MAGIRRITAVTAVVLFLTCYQVEAAVFICNDGRGAIRYTNAPTDASCTVFFKRSSSAVKKRRRQTPGSSSYDEHIWVVGNRYRIDPYLIKAVIRTESDFDSRAVSTRGAQGLMQLMPETARDLHVTDPFNARDNIDGGTRYLRYLMDTFDGNLVLSLAAYNAGPGAVRRARGIPKYQETVQYVVKVLKYYRGYKDGSRS